MKITVLLLLLTLTFTPITSVAQILPEVEIPIVTQARSDAQRDTENYNAISWGVTGFFVPIVNVGLCLLAPEVTSSIYTNTFGYCLGLSAIPVACLTLPHIKKVSPPPERLMGKSAEYVSVYVESYTRRIKHKRLKYATYGCAAGSVVPCVLGICLAGAVSESVGEATAEWEWDPFFGF